MRIITNIPSTYTTRKLTSNITTPSTDIAKMPPKKATMSSVYIVTNNSGIEGAYASNKAAEARAGDFKNGKVVEQALVGGSIAVAAEEKSAKPTKKSKAIKNEDEDEEEDENDGAPAKKTKPPEEQRAANAKKPAKAGDDDLPGRSHVNRNSQ